MKQLVAALMVISFLSFTGTVSAADYVGSEQCFSCHTPQYNDWQASGHPWKLRKASKARYSKLPLPPGYSWDEISYVIGGANKKARYIDLQGYIITSAKDGSEVETQYNIEDGSWSFYHKGEKTPYKCGPCHMTAYSSDGNQDGRPGMIGTWAEDGIGCEECHGPGQDHIRKPSKQNITIDSSAQGCGKCHQRGGINPQPPAKDGFIEHHEQINELLSGSHNELNCTECHDPHKRAILAKDNCASCHKDAAAAYTKNIHAKDGIKCSACHMPKMSKSAISVNKYTGDVRSHIFKITTEAGAVALLTTEKEGKKTTYASGLVTLDFACLGCHLGRDTNWASMEAKKIHK